MNNTLAIAIAVAVAVLFIFSLLCTQVFNSDDDFYMLYMLAGGYGNKPTHILHYANGWNPWLFLPVSRLFAIQPHFNWYSLLLLLLQLSATVNLVYTLLTTLRRIFALIAFLVFFLFFGFYLFQSLNVSNTSLLLAISGCTAILAIFIQTESQTRLQPLSMLTPSVLIILSGMLRMHTLVFYASLVLMAGLVLLPRRRFLLLLTTFFILGTVLLGLTSLHDLYYEKVIPNAEAEEKRRSSFFYIANHPIVKNDRDTGRTRLKNSIIRSWFIADTAFVRQADLDSFIGKYSTNRIVNVEPSSQAIYWMFVNGRIYIILLGFLSFLFILLKAYRPLKQWLILVLVVAAIFTSIVLFAKMTSWIFTGLFGFLFLSAAFGLRNEKMEFTLPFYFAMGIVFLNAAWAVKLIDFSNSKLKRSTVRTKTLLNMIQRHPTALFISTAGFDDNGFYIWDTPSQYPLKNLIHKEQFLTNSYHHTLQRFRIPELIKGIPTNPNVYLLDNSMPFYKEYYQAKFGWEVEKKKAGLFQHPEVYQLSVASQSN